MPASKLKRLVDGLRASRAFAHKRDINPVISTLQRALPPGTVSLNQGVPVGDDCAALPDGNGYLLFAIEGFLNEFVAAEPWFAGWCSVMVNLSDIAAMGGRALAVVDALWATDSEQARPILDGMAAACAAYGVPLVGGHTNTRNDRGQLAVSVLGRARNLLSSFAARPGDHLLMAIDLHGRYHEPHPFWDAATGTPPEQLRAALNVLPELAESGLCHAAKDISNAGPIGTTLMLLECSGGQGRGLGAVINLDALPRPAVISDSEADLMRWLLSFPSFGFVLSVAPEQVGVVRTCFALQGVDCADVGRVDGSGLVRLGHQQQEATLWNFAEEAFMGCSATAPELRDAA